MSSPKYELYYFPGGIPARGEFARLLFAETNTPYTEPFYSLTFPEMTTKLEALKKQNGIFALPILHVSSPSSPDLWISQSGVMCRYLSMHLDGGRLAAKTEVDDWRAQQVIATAVDAVGEGHDAWRALDKNASYESQKKETQPFIDFFVNKRLPQWLDSFEQILVSNGGKHFVGKDLSYVDIYIFHWLHGVEFQCPEVYKKAAIPHLRGLKDAIQSRPGIAKRIAERKPYGGTGPCF